MKRVYVCGSLRFKREIQELEQWLEKEKIGHKVSKKKDSHGILGCLKKIDYADVVYVVDPGGYVGKSVCIDIGYAYAKNKPTYLMHAVDDPPVKELTNGVLSPRALIDFLKGA
jgi:nucleoside 2-deoxyribosyltransferase